MADEQRQDPAGSPAGDDRARRSRGVRRLRRAHGASANDYYDRLLRKTAEFDNYRKRIDRERREQADQSVADLLLDLLLVVDDFDRALTVGADDGRRRLSQGRRAHSREAARSAAQAGRPRRSKRSARTSIRTCTRRSRTKKVPSIARAKSSARCGAAT